MYNALDVMPTGQEQDDSPHLGLNLVKNAMSNF